MALSDALAPLVRRWYIALLGLILAGALGWSAWVLSPPKYTARGLVMILPSIESTGPKANPLLNMSGLDLPARLLVAYYSSEPAQTDMAAFAPDADVRVTMEEATRGPIVAIDITDVTSDGAIRTLQHVTETIPPNLAQIQQSVGTPKRSAVRSMPLVLDTQADRDQSRTIQLLVAAVVAGVAVTLLITYSIDGIVLRRAALKDEGERDENPSERHAGELTDLQDKGDTGDDQSDIARAETDFEESEDASEPHGPTPVDDTATPSSSSDADNLDIAGEAASDLESVYK